MSKDNLKKYFSELIGEAIAEKQYEKIHAILKKNKRVNAVRRRLLDSIKEETQPK